MKRVVEIAAVAVVALFVILALAGDHPVESPVREYIVAHGVDDTGAVNLVAAIYLGYRAFDTLGETIVLLIAVSGVMFLVKRSKPPADKGGDR